MSAETLTPATELSTADLKALLAEREKEEKQAKEAEKEAYLSNREIKVNNLFNKAENIATLLEEFKKECHEAMQDQADELAIYGGIRSNSKGGFSILDNTGSRRIKRRRDTNPLFDERALKGVGLLKDFLGDTIKKKDVKLYEILMGFLERNANGDLEYAKVMELLKHEDKYDDPRWIEGLALVKESYSLTFKAYTYEFSKKDETGKWQNLTLNFSSI